ncbi:MAG: right-handed parallel beta-helix repeat-containing protein [Phycisphaerales bacterium]|nr:right-handed parallel beta-helix repeat-containing protein [Phycisphaerales bacterium]
MVRACVRRRVTSALVLVALSGLSAGSLAGPLNPPAGPVASTGKTLTEVEARTAVNTSNTPGDATAVLRITQPGSYYLTGNVQGVAGKNGIVIASADVTLDLNGFTVQGVAGAFDGIKSNVPLSRITVRNGTVRGFPGSGITFVLVDPSSGHRIEDVLAEGNGSGILVGDQSIVRGCTSRSNTASGISAGVGSLVESCVASGNGTRGIVVSDRSAVRECVSTSNLGAGIVVFNDTVVADCNASRNQLDGISVWNDRNTLRGNTLCGNGNGGDGAGIQLSGTGNRVEANHCSGADGGIRVVASGNFIARNTCSSNTQNWNVTAGNVCLVVNAATNTLITGNAGGVSAGSSDPNANFSH